MTIYAIKTEILPDDSKPEGWIRVRASQYGGVDCYDDTIEPGAYDRVVEEIKSGRLPMPKLFFNHNRWEVPPGRWDEIELDDRGLILAGPLNLNLQTGRDLYEGVKFGSVDGASVNLEMTPGEDVHLDDQGIMHIKNVRSLKEVSLCTFPADHKARIISYKAEGDPGQIKSIRDLEIYLRDAGLPATDAKTLISAAKRAIIGGGARQRDVVTQERLKAVGAKLQQILNH